MTRATLWCALALLASCSPDAEHANAFRAEEAADETRAPWFRDVTEHSGVSFTHRMGATPERHLPETMGGGGALIDAQADGAWDLYLVQSGSFPLETTSDRRTEPPNELYLGRGDGSFEDATDASGDAAHRGYGQGVAAGDVDGDGSTDLYVTNFGPDVLLLNDGAARYSDRTDAGGLGDDRWTAGALLFDADRDGDLDLYVTGYVAIDPLDPVWCGRREEGYRAYCSPDQYDGLADRFWRNRGDGTFEVADAAAGLTDTAGKGLGVICADFDGDADLDLYVANDSVENRMWTNDGEGSFVDATLLTGTGVNSDGMSEAGMGLAVGDVDADGDLDLFVTNLDEESNTLYRNDGEWFTDATARAGLDAPSRPWVGFGAAIEDFDLDGDVDIAVANGHIIHNITLYHEDRSWAQPLSLYENRGDGRFGAAPERLGDLAARRFVGRALLPGDLDGDGDADLVLVQCGREARVLENLAPHGRPSVRVHGLGTGATVAWLRPDEAPVLRASLAGPSYFGRGAAEVILAGSPEPDELRVVDGSGVVRELTAAGGSGARRTYALTPSRR